MKLEASWPTDSILLLASVLQIEIIRCCSITCHFRLAAIGLNLHALAYICTRVAVRCRAGTYGRVLLRCTKVYECYFMNCKSVVILRNDQQLLARDAIYRPVCSIEGLLNSGRSRSTVTQTLGPKKIMMFPVTRPTLHLSCRR
jgi:hypothetical protein